MCRVSLWDSPTEHQTAAAGFFSVILAESQLVWIKSLQSVQSESRTRPSKSASESRPSEDPNWPPEQQHHHVWILHSFIHSNPSLNPTLQWSCASTPHTPAMPPAPPTSSPLPRQCHDFTGSLADAASVPSYKSAASVTLNCRHRAAIHFMGVSAWEKKGGSLSPPPPRSPLFF